MWRFLFLLQLMKYLLSFSLTTCVLYLFLFCHSFLSYSLFVSHCCGLMLFATPFKPDSWFDKTDLFKCNLKGLTRLCKVFWRILWTKSLVWQLSNIDICILMRHFFFTLKSKILGIFIVHFHDLFFFLFWCFLKLEINTFGMCLTMLSILKLKNYANILLLNYH